jgi:hypothetical protein
MSKLSLVRSSLEGCNGIVGVKAVGKRSNNGSRTMGFNIPYHHSMDTDKKFLPPLSTRFPATYSTDTDKFQCGQTYTAL